MHSGTYSIQRFLVLFSEKKSMDQCESDSYSTYLRKISNVLILFED